MSVQVIESGVVCTNFCGRRICDPMTDHDPNCGAPLAERARIERELNVLKIHAAQEHIVWRCSCGEEFDSQDDLAKHHTGTQHQGM